MITLGEVLDLVPMRAADPMLVNDPIGQRVERCRQCGVPQRTRTQHATAQRRALHGIDLPVQPGIRTRPHLWNTPAVPTLPKRGYP